MSHMTTQLSKLLQTLCEFCIRQHTFSGENYDGLYLKAGPSRLKQLTNTLKIRSMSETSIPYLIRYASIILIVGVRL